MTVIFYKKKFDKFKNNCENKIFCENKNNCENNNINIHIYIFIFSQKNRFQMTLKYKICENKNHVKIKYLDLVNFVKI
jgi:hypothetical protein